MFQAMDPEFKEYQVQVIKNAQTLAKCLQAKGFKLVSGLYLFVVEPD